MQEPTVITSTVTRETEGVRLDIFAAAETGLSRSSAAKLVCDGHCSVNGKTATKKHKLKNGDTVIFTVPPPTCTDAQPQDISLDIVYEDSDIIVINKPTGMVVHPAAGNPDGTLVNALLHHCGESLSGIGGVTRPGIVHRIDKDTSGLIAVAKNDAAHLSLSEQLKTHSMRRIYLAIIKGGLGDDCGTVDAPIGRCPSDRKKMAVVLDLEKTARNAVTHWRVLERFSGFSLIQCELETGRTHQIRVHMAYIGHPLLGDAVYGRGVTDFEKENRKLINGQCLHAGRLILTHPRTGELMTFDAPPPKELLLLLNKLRSRA